MTTSCAVSQIRSIRFTIRGAKSPRRPYKSLPDKTYAVCSGRESSEAFNERLKNLFQVEALSFLNSTLKPDWNQFTTDNSLVFPPVHDGKVNQYAGSGQVYTFNQGTLLNYLKVRPLPDAKALMELIHKINCKGSFSVDEVHAFEIDYPSSYTLGIDTKSKIVSWLKDGEIIRTLTMQDGETPSGLLSALETLSETGEVDEKYATFMTDALGIDLQALDYTQQSRVFIDDMGI